MRGWILILPSSLFLTCVTAEIGGKRRSSGLGRDINTVIDWRSVRVPGQKESVTTAEENDRIAARDIPAPPLSPSELEEPLSEEEALGDEIDPIEQVLVKSNSYVENNFSSGGALRGRHCQRDSGVAPTAPERRLHEERDPRALEEMAWRNNPLHHLKQLLQL